MMYVVSTAFKVAKINDYSIILKGQFATTNAHKVSYCVVEATMHLMLYTCLNLIGQSRVITIGLINSKYTTEYVFVHASV